MLEILLLFFGLKAVITGTFNVGSGEATGLGARIAGLIWVLPLPLVILIVVGGMEGDAGADFLTYYWANSIYLVELGLIVGCGMMGYIVASVSAHSRGYGRGGMRYRTEARDDITLAKTGERMLPSLKKDRRRPPRPRRKDEMDEPEVIKEVQELEEVEDAEPVARRRKRPVRRYEDDYDDDYDYDYDEDDFRLRKRPRRTLLILLAVGIPLVLIMGGLVLFVVLNSSSLKRYEFGEPGHRFRVRMPKKATRDDKDPARVRTLEAKTSDGVEYLFRVREVEPMRGLAARETWLDGFKPVYVRDGLAVINETHTQWDSDNPGRLLGGTVAGSTTSFRARLWLVEDRLYFLLVRGTAEQVVSEDANRFLDSLELPSHPQAR